MAVLRFPQEPQTVLVRHHQVGEQDLVGPFLEPREGGGGGRRAGHGMPVVLQDRLRELAQVGIVVDDENPAAVLHARSPTRARTVAISSQLARIRRRRWAEARASVLS